MNSCAPKCFANEVSAASPPLRWKANPCGWVWVCGVWVCVCVCVGVGVCIHVCVCVCVCGVWDGTLH